ncbi:DUF2000 domain-containing protein [Vibrio sp. Of14-4]|uniref:DUF2000 family protein n=1 Tax=Vibrio tetraodonis subsp. pristinus TaxID=2695891 RepID=A0A6L8LSR4_9VIBR|nr:MULTISPECIES: DUF2000 domain-containing protein [Vibrio]MCG7490456.1 DUF2000 domain-containing protein [Vibrio sp. Of14-4]MYM58785.1 DUF2000 family protein [Vibrio tetraodonis subsp. pristinus]
MSDYSSLPDETSKRFVAVLNKKVEIGRLFNALGHMSAGLVNQVGDVEKLCFLQYQDKDEGIHPSISHYPFIVLKADNSNKIRTIRNELLERKIPFTDFTDTMIIGSSEQQVMATLDKKEQDLEYFGICMFGETEHLKEITGKFSLFK